MTNRLLMRLFKAKMMAWDLRKSGTSFYMIGKKLHSIGLGPLGVKNPSIMQLTSLAKRAVASAEYDINGKGFLFQISRRLTQ